MASSSPNSKRYVIVGGGIAGVSCAEQLSQLDPNSDIVLVSTSTLIKAVTNFQKVSRALESFDVQETSTSHLTRQCPNVTVVHSTLQDIDIDKRSVQLVDGQSIHYHKLCLCMGAAPKLISPDNPDVIGIRDTESIKTLQERLASARCVVIVGNGGIATELVYELSGCKVIWIIKDSSIGHTFFDEGAASFFLPHLTTPHQPVSNTSSDDAVVVKPLKRMRYMLDPVEPAVSEIEKSNVSGSALGPDWSSGLSFTGSDENKYVHVEYNCEISEVLTSQLSSSASPNDSWPLHVKLTNDKVYGCDFIVSATGVVPNASPVKNILHVSEEDGGIIVDNEMRTSVHDIYAAGDVCSVNWPEVSKTWFQMRLWCQARQMGSYAAKCMVSHTIGETVALDFCFELFAHVTKFFGYKVVLLGRYNAQGLGNNYELLLRVTKGVEYIKVILQEGKMVGAILIGDTDLEETFENLILNSMDLSQYGESLLDPNIDIEDYFD